MWYKQPVFYYIIHACCNCFCHYFQASIATATNIDTLIAGQEGLVEEVAVPAESIQDKVFFIFNNLSIANMDQKVSVSYVLSLKSVCTVKAEIFKNGLFCKFCP